MINPLLLEDTVRRALQEDIGFGDITTEATVPPWHRAKGVFVAKESGVLAGLDVAATAFKLLDPTVEFVVKTPEGSEVTPGQVLASITGPTRAILSAERVALNFLQHLSGIASATRLAVNAVAPYKTKIIDTRKTTPGLRALEKYAVRIGGGHNHRLGLSDAILIKDNHIVAAGGILPAVERTRRFAGPTVKIEVETESIAAVYEALEAKVDIIMLDNMPVSVMREAVLSINGQALAEASGGIAFGNLAAIAATGVDLISLGRLTHSSRALDISLNIAGGAKSRLDA